MKTYRNKLYSIPDAAKRSWVTEKQINDMIDHNIIIPEPTIFTDFIKGKDIPGLKKKYEDWQKKKKALKKTPVTMLRMDKGE